MASPSGGSTLITSAPRSASTSAASGPATNAEKSSTRTPASSRGPVPRGGGGRRAPARVAAPSGTTEIGVAEHDVVVAPLGPRGGRGRSRPGGGRPAPRRARGPARRRRPPSRRRSIQLVAGPGGEDRPPPDRPLAERAGHLVGVVALGARLVAEHLEQLGVHALAAEPHLQQLAVGAAVEEVGERRALLPVALDLGRGPLGAADHAAERGEHAVVERRLGPAAGAGERPAAQQGQHRRREQERGARARRPHVDEDRTGPVAGELGAEPGAGLDQQAVVVDRRPSAVRLGRQRA